MGGRIRDLEPRTGETAEAYRARVEPLAKDAGLLETARMQFQSFVGRLEAALHAALPEATVEEKRADAVVVRPTTQPTAPAAGSAQPRLRSVRHLLPEPDEHGAGRHADLVVHDDDDAAADDHGRPPVGRSRSAAPTRSPRIRRRSRRRPSIRATRTTAASDHGADYSGDGGGDHDTLADNADFTDDGGGFDDGGGGFDGGGFDGGGDF